MATGAGAGAVRGAEVTGGVDDPEVEGRGDEGEEGDVAD